MNAAIEAVLPLTAAQRGIYLETRVDAATYLGQLVVEVRGPVDSARIAQAWLEVQQHHAGLRSCIGTYRETQVLVIRAQVLAGARRFDLRSAGLPVARAEAMHICDDERRRGIDIVRGPLARLTVIDVSPNCTWLCLTHHHIGLDGASVRTVLADLAARCDAAPLKPTAALDDLLRAWPEPAGAGVPGPRGGAAEYLLDRGTDAIAGRAYLCRRQQQYQGSGPAIRDLACGPDHLRLDVRPTDAPPNGSHRRPPLGRPTASGDRRKRSHGGDAHGHRARYRAGADNSVSGRRRGTDGRAPSSSRCAAPARVRARADAP